MPHDPRAILLDIVTSGRFIRQFTQGLSEAEYLTDPLVQAGVERHFEIIGEALNRLKRVSPTWWASITKADRIVGFRNVLAHGYELVSDRMVWQITQENLPLLLSEVQRILDAPASSSSSDQGPDPLNR
ncbi:MAG: DUF86 domain-containing protein [Lentisphaerae bacterium]|nr:DUF86 domain-containing protein [Lentisphaerota bacterium]